ncbi:M50 family metallopeptidase [Microbacterium amylolyticum]|uniref:Membrane-associated protease RseP (Regulator of RpoE activity) n=1 Tax=Microbacterium amylolyticum TaxID=936337 RepID=A0ABS4ZG12_9MICO|nr:M50 family metallopeptidase [Microbacterium amylolyticum]MBP2436226.1 membrane-associated protease RseP (regulator of RpoE activity) [Microbacterium amylolyticum]
MTALAFAIGVLVMIVGLAVSIAIHEMGHILPAKAFGVRVGQYMIGFGPTLWSKQMGETEYGFKALPLGGFISIAGMYPPSSESAAQKSRIWSTLVQEARAANDETIEEAGDRTLYKQATWKRVVVMLGGPFMNLVLAVVLFSVLFSGIGVPQSTTTVESVSECVLPADSAQTSCEDGDPASPAAAAGLQPGDDIVSVDGTPVTTFAEASAIIRDRPGQGTAVDVLRDGQSVSLRVTPVLATNTYVNDAGEQITDEVGFVGFSPTTERVREPLWTGAEAAGDNIAAVSQIIVQLPVLLYDTAVDMFTGQDRDPNGPISVIGVGRIAGEVASYEAPIIDRIAVIINLLASLNIALMVFNLIPLLPLDGGHVVVALWDGIKRLFAKLTGRPAPKPADATRLVPLTLVVVVIMIGMAAILFAADIVNPVDIFGGP